MGVFLWQGVTSVAGSQEQSRGPSQLALIPWHESRCIEQEAAREVPTLIDGPPLPTGTHDYHFSCLYLR